MKKMISRINRPFQLSLILAILALAPAFGTAQNLRNDAQNVSTGFCSSTADAIFRACTNGVDDDFWIANSRCINITNDSERSQCFADAKAARAEDDQLCNDQKALRFDTCKLVGEERYDPNFDPALFDSDIKHPTNPNRFFPLNVGNTWEYSTATEFDTVKVENRTKLIDGVTCIVVRDTVRVDGKITEDTNDWYAQAKDGTTWYCGEETAEFETFEGDHPAIPELVNNDGTFKAGREGDKPGIIFLASPKKGAVYTEEFSPGNAEDVTKILSTTYSFGTDPKLDQGVPPQLAQLLCNGDCVVTKNFSLLEPGQFARKYYAPGIGVFLEVENTGPVSQLVNCNFDSRCSQLPTP